MQVKKVFVWVKKVTKDVVSKVSYIYTGTWLHQKTQLSSKFDMKDLSFANYILGMEIKRDHEKRKL